MFFGLDAVTDHPCCKMQEVVDCFFYHSISTSSFSHALFPTWFHTTLRRASGVRDKFSAVHAQLYTRGMNPKRRRRIYVQVHLTNRIEDLCNGTCQIPAKSIQLSSDLGKAIVALMDSLYEALDLAVFRRDTQDTNVQPTKEFYDDFIKKNYYVCPFCGLDRFKNRHGTRREDFDHYLNKASYPLAAANTKNLVPTCGTCNQDYKSSKNVLEDGVAFYPYAAVPPIAIKLDCVSYPILEDFEDHGHWKVTLVSSDNTADQKMATWEKIYSIKTRLENEVKEYFDEWMDQISDDISEGVDPSGFRNLIASARARALQRGQRRMEPKQFIMAAFYDFMLNKASTAFVESFRRSLNAGTV